MNGLICQVFWKKAMMRMTGINRIQVDEESLWWASVGVRRRRRKPTRAVIHRSPSPIEEYVQRVLREGWRGPRTPCTSIVLRTWNLASLGQMVPEDQVASFQASRSLREVFRVKWKIRLDQCWRCRIRRVHGVGWGWEWPRGRSHWGARVSSISGNVCIGLWGMIDRLGRGGRLVARWRRSGEPRWILWPWRGIEVVRGWLVRVQVRMLEGDRRRMKRPWTLRGTSEDGVDKWHGLERVDAWLARDVMPFCPRYFARVEDEAMTIGGAVRSAHRGSAPRALERTMWI